MKRLIKADEDWIAYHGTTKSKIPKILKEGLVPSGQFGPFIFMIADSDMAFNYAASHWGKDTELAVVKIQLTPENIDEIKRNSNDYDFSDSFNRFHFSYFLEELKKKYSDINIDEDSIRSNTDIDDALEKISEKYGIDTQYMFYNMESQAFKEYFNFFELTVSSIKPEQILEVIEEGQI